MRDTKLCMKWHQENVGDHRTRTSLKTLKHAFQGSALTSKKFTSFKVLSGYFFNKTLTARTAELEL